MEQANLETLFEKVMAIAHGPTVDLLEKFIDLLYAREMGEEYFSLEDEAAIMEGKAQIARGKFVTL